MLHLKSIALAAVSAFALAACASPGSDAPASEAAAGDAGFLISGTDGSSVRAVALETFENPWAMTFLPDGRALVTEKGGVIWLLDANGNKAGKGTGCPLYTTDAAAQKRGLILV